MQLTDAPAKLVEAFAAGTGAFNVIPVPSQIPITPGAASWHDGFPPLTMMAPDAGGIGPSGLDMNGIINSISGLSIWFNAGAGFPYDPTFQSTIGGYPKGARVLTSAGSGYWLSTVDNNMTDPDTGGAGWTLQGSAATSSVYASAQQTLASGNAKILFDTVEFDSGIWDGVNKRFLAPFAGKYRISGSVRLIAPTGQQLTTQIYKNGALIKSCFEAPQVSTLDLTLPFNALINCAIGDNFYPVLVNTSGVTAGISGSNEAYVFAQVEYLGN